MNRTYRIEWRPAASVESTPSLTLAMDCDAAIEAREEATRLIAESLAAHGEVRISIIGPDGVATERAVAAIAGIRSWCHDQPLPSPLIQSDWEMEEERGLACLQAGATLRRMLNRAVQARALDIGQALGLIAHSARLLDPDED